MQVQNTVGKYLKRAFQQCTSLSGFFNLQKSYFILKLILCPNGRRTSVWAVKGYCVRYVSDTLWLLFFTKEAHYWWRCFWLFKFMCLHTVIYPIKCMYAVHWQSRMRRDWNDHRQSCVILTERIILNLSFLERVSCTCLLAISHHNGLILER